MKKLVFPPCSESIIHEVSEAVSRPNRGLIHGVPNTASFGEVHGKCVQFLHANHEVFLERGYYLFDAGPFGPGVQDRRLGLVHTTDVLEIIALMRCGGKETATETVVEYFREFQKKYKVCARTVSRDLMLGWFTPPIDNPMEFAKDVVTLCPSITKTVFRGMRGLIGNIEKHPDNLELDWE